MAQIKEYTVRLPAEMGEVLRNYAYVTRQPVNEIFKRAVADYLGEHGHREAVEAAFGQVLAEHEAALKKLADL